MTTTSWAHLPNAEHIDRVLASARTYRRPWATAARFVDGQYEEQSSFRRTKIQALRGVIYEQAQKIGRYEEAVAARNAIPHDGNVWYAATDATDALVVWDDCAYILDLHPDVVRLMAAAGNGPAILLEAAVIAMHGGQDG